MAHTQVNVPDLGGIDEVEVIEICVKAGDNIEAEEALIVLESDKATMEVPAPFTGTVAEIKVSVGDKVSTGSLVAEMQGEASELEDSAGTPEQATQNEAPAEDNQTASSSESQKVKQTSSSEIDVVVPDLGGIDQVEVIELSVAAGDHIEAEESLLVLESDKATMEIPSPQAGKVLEISVAVGDKVSQGDVVGKLAVEVTSEKPTGASPAKAESNPQSAPKTQPPKPESVATKETESVTPSGSVHAGPAVRKLARELGVDLSEVSGTGPRSRIQKQV